MGGKQQKPFGKPEIVLEYLSRYVFRIAITNNRILEVKNGRVLFSWKNNRANRYQKMELDMDEFIRRFLLHILPKGFFKVRYYGIFSGRYRKTDIATAKELIYREQDGTKSEALEDGRQVLAKRNAVWDEIMQAMKNHKKANCPQCHAGRMRFAGLVPQMEMVPT